MDYSVWSNSSNSNTIILLNKTILGICLLLYSINEGLLKPAKISFIFKNHFNDFLGIILLLSFTNILVGYYYNTQIYKYAHLFIYSIMVGLFWEYVTPLYKRDSTSDVLDIVAYLLGTMVYYIILRLWRRCKRRRELKYVEI